MCSKTNDIRVPVGLVWSAAVALILLGNANGRDSKQQLDVDWLEIHSCLLPTKMTTMTARELTGIQTLGIEPVPGDAAAFRYVFECSWKSLPMTTVRRTYVHYEALSFDLIACSMHSVNAIDTRTSSNSTVCSLIHSQRTLVSMVALVPSPHFQADNLAWRVRVSLRRQSQ